MKKKKQTRRNRPRNAAGAKRRIIKSGSPTLKSTPLLQDYWKIFGRSDISSPELEAIQSFDALGEQEKVAAARKVIQQTVIDATAPPDARLPLTVEVSENLLPGYATLDAIHRAEITKLIRDISAYQCAGGTSRWW